MWNRMRQFETVATAVALMAITAILYGLAASLGWHPAAWLGFDHEHFKGTMADFTADFALIYMGVVFFVLVIAMPLAAVIECEVMLKRN